MTESRDKIWLKITGVIIAVFFILINGNVFISPLASAEDFSPYSAGGSGALMSVLGGNAGWMPFFAVGSAEVSDSSAGSSMPDSSGGSYEAPQYKEIESAALNALGTYYTTPEEAVDSLAIAARDKNNANYAYAGEAIGNISGILRSVALDADFSNV